MTRASVAFQKGKDKDEIFIEILCLFEEGFSMGQGFLVTVE